MPGDALDLGLDSHAWRRDACQLPFVTLHGRSWARCGAARSAVNLKC
jgi:hypothetical protein